MNILKTFTTVRSSSLKVSPEIEVPKKSKNIEILQIRMKSFENAKEVLFW